MSTKNEVFPTRVLTMTNPVLNDPSHDAGRDSSQVPQVGDEAIAIVRLKHDESNLYAHFLTHWPQVLHALDADDPRLLLAIGATLPLACMG